MKTYEDGLKESLSIVRYVVTTTMAEQHIKSLLNGYTLEDINSKLSTFHKEETKKIV